MKNIYELSLEKHYEWKGKLEIISRCGVRNKEELSLAYTPGVAEACLEIEKNQKLSFELTGRHNCVAVITDGTAVLGLGDIGPLAAMPVMEGKCVLFKEFAGIDAFPICVASKDADEIVRTIELISGSFGGINLEDISAPRCFEIERRLKEKLDIPVFHDDQHGTAVVAAAALINASKLTKKPLKNMLITINGAGAAGSAIAAQLLELGAGDIILCDIDGIIYDGGNYTNPRHSELAKLTNKSGLKGGLREALKGADVFIGVSKPDLVSEEMIRSMAEKPAVFAMANPSPEIMPDKAKAAGAFIVGTGRSDYPNQINNVLAFPGIFKGALSVRAKAITEKMKSAAAYAIAGSVKESELSPDFIMPEPFNKAVAESVAKAVAAAHSAEGGTTLPTNH